MSPDKQRIAIAEACGWYMIQQVGYDRNLQGKIEQGPLEPVPDYLNDLNAMHEAEETLGARDWDKYRRNLATMFTDHPDDGYMFAISATAAQRAEAFLKTLNLWEEE